MSPLSSALRRHASLSEAEGEEGSPAEPQVQLSALLRQGEGGGCGGGGQRRERVGVGVEVRVPWEMEDLPGGRATVSFCVFLSLTLSQ